MKNIKHISLIIFAFYSVLFLQGCDEKKSKKSDAATVGATSVSSSESTASTDSTTGTSTSSTNADTTTYDLVSFTAVELNESGLITLTVDFPDLVTGYASFKIFRNDGSTAPSCDTHDLITSTTTFIDASFTDNGFPGAAYSYTACVYNSEGSKIYSKQAIVNDSAVTETTSFRYYRLIMNSLNNNGLSVGDTYVREVKLKIDGTWQTNSMTSLTTGNIGRFVAKVSSGSYYSTNNKAWKAFDGSEYVSDSFITATNAFSSSSPYDVDAEETQFLQIDFGETPAFIEAMRIHGGYSGYNAPDSIQLVASNDGANWTDISLTDTAIDTSNDPIIYTSSSITSINQYRFYRVAIDSINNNTLSYGRGVVREINLKFNNEWQTNAMNSLVDGTIGGLSVNISSPSYYSANYKSWRAFDADTSYNYSYMTALDSFSTSSAFDAIDGDAEFIQIDFLSTPVALEAMQIYGGYLGYNAPDKIKVLASNDGSSWVEISLSDNDLDSKDERVIYVLGE